MAENDQIKSLHIYMLCIISLSMPLKYKVVAYTHCKNLTVQVSSLTKWSFNLCQLFPSSHWQWIQIVFCFLAAQSECAHRIHNKRFSLIAIILDGTIHIEKHVV